MNKFFTSDTLNKIQKYETGINETENFISPDDCKELLEYFRNLKNKSIGKNQSVDREESTKIFFDFNQSNNLKKIRKKIEEIVGEFFVNDFQPHIITSRYPLRLHVDTGKNPEDVIFKNIIIPNNQSCAVIGFSPSYNLLINSYKQSQYFIENIILKKKKYTLNKMQKDINKYKSKKNKYNLDYNDLTYELFD